MSKQRTLIVVAAVLALAVQACICPTPPEIFLPTDTPSATSAPTGMEEATPTERPTPAPTEQAPTPVTSADEPILVTGTITYTSPFFANMLKNSFVLLEDQTGFILRDKDFEFPITGQTLGPTEEVDEGTLNYSLLLPAIPRGTFNDVDNDGEKNSGVQIFAAAYWSNTWGDPFLEQRDGTGWSTAYASTITDPDRDDEIKGGFLIVWAPDDQQGFPTGFGEDEKLFTEDDPTAPIPAGYNVVDLNQEPFEIYKEAQPQIDLHEGEIAVNDYADMGYEDAFDALFEKASREYPFTEDKELDWDALYDEFAPRVGRASDDEEFYIAIRDFTWAIPDGHVGVRINGDVFFAEQGGSFGLILAELGDGHVIVTGVLSDTPAAEAGIEVGAEIIEWDGQPVTLAIDQVEPYFGPYSTEHHKRVEQIVFLTRVPPFERIPIKFRNPGTGAPEEINLTADIEYDSLFQALPYFAEDELTLPIEGQVLDESGLGYINIATFSANYNLMADLWDHYIGEMIDADVPGLIIDLRLNSGGSGGLALDFAGYFFDEEFILSRHLYFNDLTEEFEDDDHPRRLIPGPKLYEGPIVLLVSPYCVSACEGFTNAMIQKERSIVVGHYPTAGAYGEVGRGQYELPGELSLQFPTGRPETPDGELLIEGVGIVPDIAVPVTEESVLGSEDPVLDAAIEALLERIGR